MHLSEVEKRENISSREFKRDYLDLNKPVVIKDMAKDWKAREKWSFRFFENSYGDLSVPIFDPESYFKSGENYMRSYFQMPFRKYLRLIQKEPTKLRIHIFQLMKEAPELARDFELPSIMSGFLKKFPALFFGGEGATLRLHYDLDCSHVFLTHFQTSKEVILFPYKQKDLLYHLPYTVQAAVDVQNPDYTRYPALQYASGYRTVINHGETLFIPRRYWHSVHYCEPGFSLSVRSNDSIYYSLHGLLNIARHFVLDKGLNRLLGEPWLTWKNRKAIERANNAVEKIAMPTTNNS